MTNLAHMLTETAAEHGERPALKLDDVQLPYAAIEQGTRYTAGLLAEKGVGPGDRVGLMLPNVPYPRHVWLADELPKGPTGKILKREIVVPDEHRRA